MLGPLAGLVVFGGFHWRYTRHHELRVAQIKRLDHLARQEKSAHEQQTRVKAEEQARLTIAKRNQERADKEQLEEAQKQERVDLEQRRDTAAGQVRALLPQLDRLRSELETARAAIARSEERKRELQKEQSFLDRYIDAAETNRATFFHLLEKMEAREHSPAATVAPHQAAPAEKG